MKVTGITMDGKYYKVFVEYDSMNRSFELVSGNNEGVAISQRIIPDVCGTKYTYEMNVLADPDHPDDYDDFFYDISAPVDSHIITLPFGQTTITFEARIIEGSDTYKGVYANYLRWDGLNIKFEPMEPQRK